MKVVAIGLVIAAGIMGLMALLCLGINPPIDADFEEADIDHRANMARQVH
jgi:hypothetical protein